LNTIKFQPLILVRGYSQKKIPPTKVEGNHQGASIPTYSFVIDLVRDILKKKFPQPKLRETIRVHLLLFIPLLLIQFGIFSKKNSPNQS